MIYVLHLSSFSDREGKIILWMDIPQRRIENWWIKRVVIDLLLEQWETTNHDRRTSEINNQLLSKQLLWENRLLLPTKSGSNGWIFTFTYKPLNSVMDSEPSSSTSAALNSSVTSLTNFLSSTVAQSPIAKTPQAFFTWRQSSVSKAFLKEKIRLISFLFL